VTYKFLFAVVLLGGLVFLFEMPVLSEEPHIDEKNEAVLDDHEDHEDEDLARLSPEELKTFGIEIAIAGPGSLGVMISLPGEVVVNPDRFAHIVPRVPGVVRHVIKNLGDPVKSNEVIAIIESRDLSDLKSAFLAAKERLTLFETTFRREETLWEDGISSEREYIAAKQAFFEAQIESRSSEHKLHALGFSDAYLKELPNQPDASYTRYELTAPFDGRVVAKHITLGENLKDDTEVFSIADLNTVWVLLAIYQKDLPHILLGQEVQIVAREGGQLSTGTISYISPVIDEATRTASARVVLSNPHGDWRPGLFVNGQVILEHRQLSVRVSRSAIQKMENQSVVFIQTEEGFKAQPVQIGRMNETHVEILEGLSTGQRYASSGAFTIKAQLSKGEFESGHNH